VFNCVCHLATFTFTSLRRPGFPFSLTMYVNGRQDSRLSTCCESKHAAGTRFGGKHGRFGLVSVENGVPCERYDCVVELVVWSRKISYTSAIEWSWGRYVL